MKRVFSLVLLVGGLLNGWCASSPATSPNGPVLVTPFSLHDVRLREGIFLEAQNIAVDYLLSLEPDRLLANFRKEAGLQPRAKHYGGWESRGVSGHCGGHYLSACAMAYASTGDRRFLARVNYFVAELAECQRANGNGYVAAIPEGKRVYAEVAAGNIRSAGFDLNGCWVPNYTLHKQFAGLLDAYVLCTNQQALAVARGLADWFATVHEKLTFEQMQKILAAEHGGLNESFAELYALTGKEDYLQLSRRIHHAAILDPLARREEILPGKHANTQIPKLIGLARRYELTGSASDRAAADFFWDRVVNHHSYVTGGHCDAEHFGPPDKLNNRLSDNTTETCNVYNMLKLTRHVFGWNPDAKVADFYERALLNHIRSTQHPDGRVIYNLTLRPGGTKVYQSKYDGFTCCVGTGMENHVKYGEGIYFKKANALYVNLFIASDLNWEEKGVKVRQETRWPFADHSTLTISCEGRKPFELRVRRPHWVNGELTLLVNGKKVPTQLTPEGFARIDRTWRNGDRVEIQFPMGLRTESMPDNQDRVGVFYGPTLLAANLGPASDPNSTALDYVPVMVTGDRAVAQWVKPMEVNHLTFRTEGVGKPRDVELMPFFSLHDRRYTVFLDRYTESEWAQREAQRLAELKWEQELNARTLDLLRIGEMQPERDHQVEGERTSAGEALGRKWRHATDGGWFGFTLKVASDRANDLVLTFWGGETGKRNFDVLVDGVKVGTQTLNMNQPGKFFDVVYPLDSKLTSGKETVKVRLQAHPDNWAGGLFGARMMLREAPAK
jgi:DUF1680 family protein